VEVIQFIDDHSTMTIEDSSEDPIPHPIEDNEDTNDTNEVNGDTQGPDPILLPDLEITILSLDPESPTVGRQVSLIAEVQNTGDSPAENVVVKWILDTNYNYNVTEVIGELDPGGTPVLCTLISPRGYAFYGPISTKVEVTSNTDESDPFNNHDTNTVQVGI